MLENTVMADNVYDVRLCGLLVFWGICGIRCEYLGHILGSNNVFLAWLYKF